MRDAHYILLDDGPLVENVGDVVAGSPDQLDAALKGSVVRLCADKRRQK